MSASNPEQVADTGEGSASEEGGDKHEPVDVRLLVPAAAGWLTAVLLVAHRPLVGILTAAIAATIGGVFALLFLRGAIDRHRERPGDRHRGTPGDRRAELPGDRRAELPGDRRTQVGWAVVGVLVVVAGMGLAAGLQVEGLRAGPVTGLAAESASVGVKLKIDGDPSVRRSPGSRRPPYVVVKATIEEVRSRGTVTRVRTPVFVIGSTQWQHVRYGQRVDANGRLEAVERGSDVAAMLSIRSAPRIVDQPPWWLRAAEKVRAGLRESVAGQPDDVRGLVPALVMGDESGLSAELTEDFQTTGLTHLSAVSGTNVESRDGCASNTAALARRPLCWRPAGYRSGAATRAQLDSERSASKGSMWRLCSPESDQGFLALGSSRGADEFAPSIGPGMYPDRSRSLSGARGTR